MELQLQIKEGIDQWISRKPSQRSIHALAKRTGVKYSTLINVYNLVINPPVERLVPVLLMVFGSTKTKEIINVHQPKILDAFSKILGAEKSVSNDNDDVLFDFLDRKEHFIVYLLSITTGVQKEMLTSLFGISYTKALKDLHDMDLVKFENGKYFAKKEFISFPSTRKILSFIPYLLSVFDDDNISKGGVAYFFTENVSTADLEKIQVLQKRYHKDLKKILEESDKEGELCWFGACFSNFIDTNNIDEVDI